MAKNKITELDGHKLGDNVWYMDTYDNLHSGTIIEFRNNYAAIRESIHNVSHTKVSSLYPSKEDCLHAAEEKSQNRIMAFLSDLNTVEDLVRFMYDNVVSSADEYTDWDAQKAAEIAAKNILNIDLRESAETMPDLGDALKDLQSEQTDGQSL